MSKRTQLEAMECQQAALARRQEIAELRKRKSKLMHKGAPRSAAIERRMATVKRQQDVAELRDQQDGLAAAVRAGVLGAKARAMWEKSIAQRQARLAGKKESAILERTEIEFWPGRE